jgi:hypothetical protein
VAIFTTLPLRIDTTILFLLPRWYIQLVTLVFFRLPALLTVSLDLYFKDGFPQASTRRLMESPVLTNRVPHLKLPACASNIESDITKTGNKCIIFFNMRARYINAPFIE